MKIKLLTALPIGPEHGCTKGRVMDVIDEFPHCRTGDVRWKVMGDLGERVGVIEREAVEIDVPD